MPADDLRARLTEVLNTTIVMPDDSIETATDKRDRHDTHRFLHNCAVCQTNVPAMVTAVLAVLAEDPGSLPARMAEAIASHEWTDFPRSAHNQHNYYAECAVCQRDVLDMVEVALSVRDELVGHLSARAAKAEARVEHAEAGAQLSSERLAKARQELAQEKDDVQAWIRSANAWQARAENAEAAVKRVRVQHRQDDPEDPMCRHCRMTWPCPTSRTIAGLTAPGENTTTPARETA